MAYEHDKVIELYMLKSENYPEDIAPNQRKFYREAAEWLKENRFDSAEAAAEAMKQTKYYMGGSEALAADDAFVREKAKAFRGDRTAERKDAFRRIFNGYMQMTGNPQQEYRREAAEDMAAALRWLRDSGADFDEMASDEGYQKLIMTTEKGLENFVAFVRSFTASGYVFDDGINDIASEQAAIAEWVKENKDKLAAVGNFEKWNTAACIAVPSQDPCGYDFILRKEVEW